MVFHIQIGLQWSFVTGSTKFNAHTGKSINHRDKITSTRGLNVPQMLSPPTQHSQRQYAASFLWSV